VFDSNDYTRVVEDAETDSRAPLYNYLQPRGFVAPRAVEFVVQYEWGAK
jgi:hypothetical protein